MNKGNLECLYDAIKEKRKERDSHIKIVTKIDKEIQNEILEYRIESVKRVLEYVDRVLNSNDKQLMSDINNKIVHCINKLNGNIDGIELGLDEKE